VAPIDPPSSPPPFNSPPSPPPKDLEQTREAPERRKKKFPVPKLVSPFKQKKKTTSTANFLSKIALSRTTRTLDLAEHDKLAKKPKVITVSIRKPTIDDYKNIPDKYVPVRPLLKWDTLKKILAGVKRLHDWYMRASSIGIDTINVSIPPTAFVSGRQTTVITFEDMWLMMNLQRLEVQLITVFALLVSLILTHACVIISELYQFSISYMNVRLAECNMISRRCVTVRILIIMLVKELGI
jgi:hypothetical protein